MKSTLDAYFKRNPSCNEIDLFRAMNAHLSNHYATVFVDETHMHYVDYQSKVAGRKIRRELSDLWIISFSPNRGFARMTFLQAKYEKRCALKSMPFRFNGDYYQYELLSDRPLISDVSGYGFPANILSDADSDSVGSFGVFYYNSNNNLDFAYSVASDLHSNSVPSGNCAKRVLYFSNLHPNMTALGYTSKSGLEIWSTYDMDVFEYGLLQLLIGTPLRKGSALVMDVKRLFGGMSGTHRVIDQFVDFLSDIDNREPEGGRPSSGNPRILLINADAED